MRKPSASPGSVQDEVKAALEWLARYGIHTRDTTHGVSKAGIPTLAKRLGRNHELAAAFVDEPARVTPSPMDRWCRDFDNWGICDTLCFCLFDRTPHAWAKVTQWGAKREEFVKRAGFALLACLALHDKNARDEQFLECLPLIERAAPDERNFVKKGVSWALRAVGRRNAVLHAAAVTLARRLADSTGPAPRWVGQDALRDLTKPRAKGRRQ